MLFPERLRQLREQSGKRQRELANAIGVDVPMYCRYEHGERRPKREQVLKLARIFGVDEADLVGRWLAFAALGEIGHDRMATEALGFLKQHLGMGEEAPAPVPVKVPVEAVQPAATRLTPAPVMAKRNLAFPDKEGVPSLMAGKEMELLPRVPDASADCIVASLPLLANAGQLSSVLALTQEYLRILRPTGSLWLHLRHGAQTATLNWQCAIAMEQEQGWKLAHDIVWDKKNSDTPQHAGIAPRHDHILHFVKDLQGAWFDSEVFKRVFNELIVTNRRTTKTGQGYRRKIEGTKHMNADEKKAATEALDQAMAQLNSGEIADFRLFLRESRIPLREDTPQGRGVNAHGFYLQVTPGPAPGDVWRQAAGEGGAVTREIGRVIVDSACPATGTLLVTHCLANGAFEAGATSRRVLAFDTNEPAIAAVAKRYRPKSSPRELSLF